MKRWKSPQRQLTEAKTIDLKLGVVKFNYYEDLFSPTVTAQMLIVSCWWCNKNRMKMVKGTEKY